MRASIVLAVALLGFAGSVAWAQQAPGGKRGGDKPSAQRSVERIARPWPGPTQIPWLTPHLDPATRPPAAVISASLRPRPRG